MKKEQKITLKEIEDKIKLLGTLKFNAVNDPTNLKDCIRKVIKQDGNGDCGKATYFSKNNKLQCEYSKLRGICDIYRTVLHYYPNTKLKQVLDIMDSIGYFESYCNTTAQSVFYKPYVGAYRLPTHTFIRTKRFGGNVKLENTDYYD
jgi:hypothetical protein